eukprot:gnl/Trimastix_PCT/1515.p1 GENE.gnl/Trimastix_PCT/1515~~gnl/Trimastix_PCT/1515.p1  ORF type:complete len:902 (-),score=188.68 gnl/Trimastix_PCT/1515:63-2675(-)
MDDPCGMNDGDKQGLGQAKAIRDYILGKTIGVGTFGKVKIGTHVPSGAQVAVKVLDKQQLQLEQLERERVKREIKLLQNLCHSNIIHLFEAIESSSHIYLVTEHAPGGELFDYIVHHTRLKERDACRFLCQILNGVEYCHQYRVAHRDLKPENLLLDKHRNIKIIDFGLSNRWPRYSGLLKTACGSPCYAAPEMIEGRKYSGELTDIWSCGVILYALVCGYLPFEDGNTNVLYRKITTGDYKMPDFLSDDCKDLIARIMCVDPERRYRIGQIRQHRWYLRHLPAQDEVPSPYTIREPFDEGVIAKMTAPPLNFTHAEVLDSLTTGKRDRYSACYKLLRANAPPPPPPAPPASLPSVSAGSRKPADAPVTVVEEVRPIPARTSRRSPLIGSHRDRDRSASREVRTGVSPKAVPPPHTMASVYVPQRGRHSRSKSFSVGNRPIGVPLTAPPPSVASALAASASSASNASASSMSTTTSSSSIDSASSMSVDEVPRINPKAVSPRLSPLRHHPRVRIPSSSPSAHSRSSPSASHVSAALSHLPPQSPGAKARRTTPPTPPFHRRIGPRLSPFELPSRPSSRGSPGPSRGKTASSSPPQRPGSAGSPVLAEEPPTNPSPQSTPPQSPDMPTTVTTTTSSSIPEDGALLTVSSKLPLAPISEDGEGEGEGESTPPLQMTPTFTPRRRRQYRMVGVAPPVPSYASALGSPPQPPAPASPAPAPAPTQPRRRGGTGKVGTPSAAAPSGPYRRGRRASIAASGHDAAKIAAALKEFIPAPAETLEVREFRGVFNPEATSHKLPSEIATELVRVLPLQGIAYQRNRFTFNCEKEQIRFELEICRLPGLKGLCFIHLKRHSGDTFAFKAVVTQLFRELKL